MTSAADPTQRPRGRIGPGGWLLLAGLAGVGWTLWGTAEVVPAGQVAPHLSASLAEGGTFDLRRERGRIVVLNFFATWCGPCRDEAPDLTRVHRRLAESGGTFLGLIADDGPLERVARSARGLGVGYPVGRAFGDAWDRYRVTQLPTTYVVDGEGVIAWSRVGRVTEGELEAAIRAARGPRPRR